MSTGGSFGTCSLLLQHLGLAQLTAAIAALAVATDMQPSAWPRGDIRTPLRGVCPIPPLVTQNQRIKQLRIQNIMHIPTYSVRPAQAARHSSTASGSTKAQTVASAVQQRQQTTRPMAGTLRNLVSLGIGAPQYWWPPLQKPCRQQGPAGVPLAWPTAAAAHQSSASPKQHQPLFPAKQHQPLNPATAAGGQRPKRSRLWPTPTRPRQTRRP